MVCLAGSGGIEWVRNQAREKGLQEYQTGLKDSLKDCTLKVSFQKDYRAQSGLPQIPADLKRTENGCCLQVAPCQSHLSVGVVVVQQEPQCGKLDLGPIGQAAAF